LKVIEKCLSGHLSISESTDKQNILQLMIDESLLPGIVGKVFLPLRIICKLTGVTLQLTLSVVQLDWRELVYPLASLRFMSSGDSVQSTRSSSAKPRAGVRRPVMSRCAIPVALSTRRRQLKTRPSRKEESLPGQVGHVGRLTTP
jgi:hypothetical protein